MSTLIKFQPRAQAEAKTSEKPAATETGKLVPMNGIQLGSVFQMMAIMRQIKKMPAEERGKAWKKKSQD